MSKLKSIILPDSITQTGRHEIVSDKYKSVDTSKIIETLTQRGFSLHSAKQSNIRKQTNSGFQKHMVWMKYDVMKTKEGIPSIVIMNSHNRSSSLKLHVGYIRWACANQLVGGEDISSESIRHSIGWEEKTNIFLDSYLAKVEHMNRQHDRMRNQYMSDAMIRDLAYQAGKIRYNSIDILDSNELALVTRSEDIGNDLYTVFNRIQESLLKGSFKRRIPTLDDDGLLTYSPWQKASKITSTDEILRINKAIRDLALKYS